MKSAIRMKNPTQSRKVAKTPRRKEFSAFAALLFARIAHFWQNLPKRLSE
jgi:hypothetical protein